MNERIRELSKQAFEYTLVRLNSGLEFRDFQPIWSEKFAELIVFECTKAVMDGTKEGDHYAQRIEQHFDHGTGGVLYYGDGE